MFQSRVAAGAAALLLWPHQLPPATADCNLGAAAVEAVETHSFNISGTGFEIALALVEA